MCIRDRFELIPLKLDDNLTIPLFTSTLAWAMAYWFNFPMAVSYTHLRAHETVLDLVCRLLLEKKKPHTIDPAFSLVNI